jgi:hypothetical protein
MLCAQDVVLYTLLGRLNREQKMLKSVYLIQPKTEIPTLTALITRVLMSSFNQLPWPHSLPESCVVSLVDAANGGDRRSGLEESKAIHRLIAPIAQLESPRKSDEPKNRPGTDEPAMTSRIDSHVPGV